MNEPKPHPRAWLSRICLAALLLAGVTIALTRVVEVMAPPAPESDILDGKLRILARFDPSRQGEPSGSLLLSGNALYGSTTSFSSMFRSGGILFHVNLDGTGSRTLVNFGVPGPRGSLVSSGGAIFSGVTLYGTIDQEVFSVDANGTMKAMARFGYPGPTGSLALSGNALFGATIGKHGSIFRVNRDGTGLRTLVQFNDDKGDPPAGPLVISGNTLFGFTRQGGKGGEGTLFRVNLDGGDFRTLVEFNGANGADPAGTLTLSGNTLYGTTPEGGSWKEGTLFRVNVEGTGFQTLVHFGSDFGRNGEEPVEELTLLGNTLYGVTKAGHKANGDMCSGILFRVDTDGRNFEVLAQFDGGNGGIPIDPPLSVNGMLYGMTGRTLYRLYPDGASFQTLVKFGGRPSDLSPVGPLLRSGNTLFGLTRAELGPSGGTVFAYEIGRNRPPHRPHPFFGERKPALPPAAPAECTTVANNDGTLTITGCIRSGGNVIIPARINGVAVTGIGDGAFEKRGGMFRVSISNGITTIGDHAFGGCRALATVVIPDSVTSIGPDAFHDCPSLTEITIPAGVTNIASDAFGACAGLSSIRVDPRNPSYSSVDGVLFDRTKTSLIQCPTGKTGGFTIPNTVGALEAGAFSGCGGLTSVTIPDGVTSIGDHAFEACTKLTIIKIPDSVTNIGNEAFKFCASLDGITLPDGVICIGSEAFVGCSALTSVTIGKSLSNIGRDAFSSCPHLASIGVDEQNLVYRSDPDGVLFSKDGATILRYPEGKVGDYVIPKGVTTIGRLAFRQCSRLSSVTIPESVIGIGDSAFNGCSGLTKVTIPKSVTAIGGAVFFNCGGLTSIKVDPLNTSYGNDAEDVLFDKDRTVIIEYPPGKTGSYAIPSGVKTVANSSFTTCRGLTGVTIPNTVTTIEMSAFEICPALTKVTIPQSVTALGMLAFGAGPTSADFLGDAPSMGWEVFGSPASRDYAGVTIHYFKGAKGFASPTWKGYTAIGLLRPPNF